jgi:cytochrome P450
MQQQVEGMVCTSCLKETLRKYTVVPGLTRVATAEVELCGARLE